MFKAAMFMGAKHKKDDKYKDVDCEVNDGINQEAGDKLQDLIQVLGLPLNISEEIANFSPEDFEMLRE